MNSIYRNKTIDKITKKLKLLGDDKTNAITFMNIRLISTIIVFIFCLLFLKRGYFLGPIIAVLFYISFEYYLDYKIKKRSEKLNYEAIFFFQILSITLENGGSLRNAIEITTDNIDSEISLEFKKLLKEINYGRSMTEALERMKERIPSEEINTVILNLRESTIFGNDIIESLNNQIDYLRDKKILNIRSLINKLPMKISVISVIFIVPIVMMLILGPVLINYLIK